MHGKRILHKAGGFLLRIIAGLAFAALIGLVLGIVVQYLWNALMPALFGLAVIDFWQAVGMVILSRLLFGGMSPKGHGHGHGPFSHHHRHKLREYYRRKHLPWAHGMQDTPWDFTDDAERKLYRDFWHEKGQAEFEAFRKARQEQQ